MNCEDLLYWPGVWEWHGEGLWSGRAVRGGPLFRQGLQAASVTTAAYSSPQGTLSNQLSDEKNKSHGQAAKFPQFVLVTFPDLLT